jgi:hypothetical protein
MNQRTLTFTATTPWLQLMASVGGNALMPLSSSGGVNNIWIDDGTFTRLN